jgi:hypothetical protein
MTSATAYQCGNAISRCYTSRQRIRDMNTKGFQQLTKDQRKSVLKELDLLIELLREETRLYDNTKATNQGAHEGVNSG